MDWMYRNCSTTAQRGALELAPQVPRRRDARCSTNSTSAFRTGEEARIVIEANGRPDYRERLDAELQDMADQEIWRAGKRLRELRP